MSSSPLAILSTRAIGKVGLVLSVFLVSCSQLISLPLDKVAMLGVIVMLLFHQVVQNTPLSKNLLFPIIGFAAYCFLPFLLNLPDSSLIIFFPVIGLFFAGLVSSHKEFLTIVYWALFIHIVLGIVLVFSSYLIGMNSYVHQMYDKGLPFLHAAKGFTTTVQSYGTLLISWFLIYYWKKENGQNGKLDSIAFCVVILGLILTFNRNTVVIFYLILFFKHRKIFVFTVVCAVLFYLYYFEFINKLLFNVSTISSRADLLQAFRISFFDHSGWMHYLFGHGNNIVGDVIARTTKYRTGYIENGTSVLVYTYGFIGYIAYLIAVMLVSVMLFVRNKIFYAAMFFYIFIIAQQFTHEFYATTLYLMISIFLIILYSKSPGEAKNNIFSSTE
ncbi:hypothetical protein J2X69_002890 [Algoriphagus sp. 4150]|uniref:hypothetical protein n=1 Tax=Algoriphagus sp. 4150 TaxID=2817756 RepID=UPI00285CA7F6|nr:hypothetical protein [Algoriphagus sp. 4150]MDR7130534.1 hypothetical protein [Algoriphagus sp. 4150]